MLSFLDELQDRLILSQQGMPGAGRNEELSETLSTCISTQDVNQSVEEAAPSTPRRPTAFEDVEELKAIARASSTDRFDAMIAVMQASFQIRNKRCAQHLPD